MLLSVLLNLITEKGECIISAAGIKTQSDFLKRIFDYVSKNFNKSITLETVAAELHLAPAYFSALFSKTSGSTFISYLTSFRLNYAKQMLISSDKTVTEICFEAGFGSLSHFLREFKKHFGVTPLSYRKNNA